MQLWAALESYEAHAIGVHSTYVLYKATTNAYEMSYSQVKERFPDYTFVKERNFYNDTMSILCNPIHTHVMFFVDDSIFLDKINVASICDILKDKHIIGFSLRLGLNISRCYTQGKSQSLREYESHGEFLRFIWTEQKNDFAYPLELSSSVYRLSIIRDIILRSLFWDPNTLELVLQKHKKMYMRYNILASYSNSRAFSNPVNIVTTSVKNRHGCNKKYQVHELLLKFIAGYRIDINYFRNILITSPHQEVDLHLTV